MATCAVNPTTSTSPAAVNGIHLSRLSDARLFIQPHLSAKKFPGAQAIHLIPAKPTMQRSNTAREQWPAASHSTTVPELYPTSMYGPLFGSCLFRGNVFRGPEFGTSACLICSARGLPERAQVGTESRGPSSTYKI